MSTVLIAMSGGVDSAVAALLLRRAGYDCVGATMALYPPGQLDIPAVRDARTVADGLGIPHHVLDGSDVFARCVVRNFIAEYEAGRTPNPCVQCNRTVKFGWLLEQARDLGCDAVATGHYVRTRTRADGRVLLEKGADPARDQSYFLYSLTQEQLSHALFPLGALTKDAVRALATENGLPVAHRPDSQDICFVPDGDYAAFIRRATGRDYPPGDFVDEDGRVLGRHRGLIEYTPGQRRGLGVSAPRPLYVLRKRPADNTVVLAENDRLFARALRADSVSFIPFDTLTGPLRCAARLRSRHREQPCTVTSLAPGAVSVVFDEPQRAIAPGQSVVFYDNTTVLGGGIITGSSQTL